MFAIKRRNMVHVGIYGCGNDERALFGRRTFRPPELLSFQDQAPPHVGHRPLDESVSGARPIRT